MKIPCISVMQPHAQLIALNAKSIETRSRDFTGGYRGPLAIHASKGFPKANRLLCWSEPFASVLERANPDPQVSLDVLPLGCIVAVGDLVDVVRILPYEQKGFTLAAKRVNEHLGTALNRGYDRYQQEIAFGDYGPGRWMLLLSNVVALPKPIPAKGRLGLWEWEAPDDVVRLLDGVEHNELPH